MLELRQLRYFVAIAEELSFTAAAMREGISQPALSRQIKNLEEDLGVELLVRSPSTALSPAGQQLLPRARKLLAEASKAELSVRQFAACRLHRLDVGYFSGPLNTFISAALNEFQQSQPEVKVVLHELSPGDQIDALRDGTLDIAIVGHATLLQEKSFDLFKLAKIPLRIVFPRSSTADDWKEVIARYPLVRLNEKRFPGRKELIETWAKGRDLSLKWTEAADGLSSALLKVTTDESALIMPSNSMLRDHPGLQSIALPAPHESIHFFAAAARDERRQTVRTFLNTCRAHAKHLA